MPDQFPGISWLADIASGGYCSRTIAGLRYDGRYTPPSLQGTLAYPATAGGVEWGGGALDPRSNTYIVNILDVAQIYKLLTRADYDKVKPKRGQKNERLFRHDRCALRLHSRLSSIPLGMPCWNGPTARSRPMISIPASCNWRKPFGEVQKWGFYMPQSWGSVTIGSPVITKSGVIFIGASMDSRVRAHRLKTGKVLWQSQVDAPAVAEPAVYTYKGKEYVVFAVGGNSILEPKVSRPGCSLRAEIEQAGYRTISSPSCTGAQTEMARNVVPLRQFVSKMSRSHFIAAWILALSGVPSGSSAEAALNCSAVLSVLNYPLRHSSFRGDSGGDLRFDDFPYRPNRGFVECVRGLIVAGRPVDRIKCEEH